jgi:hypothetical protein
MVSIGIELVSKDIMGVGTDAGFEMYTGASGNFLSYLISLIVISPCLSGIVPSSDAGIHNDISAH